MKKLRAIGITILLLVLTLNGRSVRMGNQTSGKGTDIELNCIDISNLFVSGKVYTVELNPSKAIKGYHGIKIDGLTTIKEEGKPALPVLRYLVLLPRDGNVDITVNYGKEYFIDSVKIEPVPQPVAENKSNRSEIYKFDESVYGKNRFYPGEDYSVVKVGVLRGAEIALLTFYPVHFNPVEKKVKVFTDFSIEITISGDFGFLMDKAKYKYFWSLLKNLCVNTGNGDKWLNESTDLVPKFNFSGCDYLIITDAMFKSVADTLAKWKRLMGLRTEVVTVQEIGKSSDEIREFIKYAYFTWDIPPSFVLLLGDAEYIPVFYKTQHPREDNGMIGTDLYYAAIDGSDYVPDLFIGRIAVDTPLEAMNFIKSVIDFEKGIGLTQSFFENIALIGYFQDDDDPDTPVNERDGYEDRRFIRTCEELRDFFLRKGYSPQRIYYAKSSVDPRYYNKDIYGGEPLPDELLRKNGFNWDGGAEDIIREVNKGTFLVVHRDHGSRNGWSYPSFKIGNISSLRNGFKKPLVFSIECLAGWFDNETDGSELGTGENEESFAEYWIRNFWGGAIGIIASTRVSYSGYNDVFAKGLVDAIWPDLLEFDGSGTGLSESRAGEVINYGKLYLLQEYWGGSKLKVEFEEFHYLGDPSMVLRTRYPEELVVEHDNNIKLGDRQFKLSVSQPGCQISIVQGDKILVTGENREAGTLWMELPPVYDDEQLSLCVWKKDFKPFISNISIVKDDLDTLLVTVGDVIDENGDGLCSPGEVVTPVFLVEKTGSFTPDELKINFSMPDTIVEYRSSLNYNWPGDKSTVEIKDFSFKIRSDCPENVEIPIDVSFYFHTELIASYSTSFRVFYGSPEMKVKPERIFVDREYSFDHYTDTLIIENCGYGRLSFSLQNKVQRSYVIGDTVENTWLSLTTGVGNIFRSNDNTTLARFATYVDVKDATMFYFFVYEGEEKVGYYDLVTVDSAKVEDKGRFYLWSGRLNVPIRKGFYYFIGISWIGSNVNVSKVSQLPPFDYGEIVVETGCLAKVGNPPDEKILQRVNLVNSYSQIVEIGEGDWLEVGITGGEILPGERQRIPVQIKGGVSDTLLCSEISVKSNSTFCDSVTVPVIVKIGNVENRVICNVEKHDGIADEPFYPGEETNLGLFILNPTRRVLKEIEVVLDCEERFVQLLDSTEVIDNLDIGESKTIDNAFRVIVSPLVNTEDITFKVKVSSGEEIIDCFNVERRIKPGLPRIHVDERLIQIYLKDGQDSLIYPLYVSNNGKNILSYNIENSLFQQETIGTLKDDAWLNLSSGIGNIFYQVSKEKLLTTSFYLRVIDSAKIYFFVFESDTFPGTFSIIAEDSVVINGDIETWIDFDADCDLLPKRYYYLGVSWVGKASIARIEELLPIHTKQALIFSSTLGVGGSPPNSVVFISGVKNYPIAMKVITGKGEWLYCRDVRGLLYPGEIDTIELVVKRIHEDMTSCNEFIKIYSNDPYNRVLSIPLVLTTTSAVACEHPVIPRKTMLMQNYPNPFNGLTWIEYSVRNNERIEICIYDLLGRKVRTIVAGNHKCGTYRILWNGKDERGIAVPSGIYFLVMQTKTDKFVKKMLLVK